MKPRRRLDQALVELGLAPSRSKAQQLIAASEVELFSSVSGEWSLATQAALITDGDQESIRIRPEAESLRYVSRGGLKMENALNETELQVQGFRVLDIGLSTGGFSDCLLRQGASAILGIDVGHGQLHASLRDDARLTAIEGLHVRDLSAHDTVQAWCRVAPPNLIVIDVSFISLTQVLPELTRLPKESPSYGLFLVKPQFEVGRSWLTKRGLVKDEAAYVDVEKRVRQSAIDHGWRILKYFMAKPSGQDGNREYFMFLKSE